MTPDLAFVFDLVAHRAVTWAGQPQPISVEHVLHLAGRRGVRLPEPDWTRSDDDLEAAAERVLGSFVDGLADCLLDEGAAARESLNILLDAWSPQLALEEDLGSDDLPGVELVAGSIPAAPLTPYEMFHRGTDAVGVRLANTPLEPVLLATASVALTEVANIHLSGYADRVRRCGSRQCGRPFLDASPGGNRRWCSARCRAREGARRVSSRGARAARDAPAWP